MTFTPSQATAGEFTIRLMEWMELEALLNQYGLARDPALLTATQAYACANARAAVAVAREVDAKRPKPREEPCPACLKASLYVPAMDRHLHQDGTSSRGCWRRIVRGEA